MLKNREVFIESMKSEIRVQSADFREIRVTFPYNPSFIEKIKTIDGRRWIKGR